MCSCTLHSPGNTIVLFNQPCLQGSAVLEHQSDMHIQQRACPTEQSCCLQVRAGKHELWRCSGHDTLIPASFPRLLSVRLEMPPPVCRCTCSDRARSSALEQDGQKHTQNGEVVQGSPPLPMEVAPGHTHQGAAGHWGGRRGASFCSRLLALTSTAPARLDLGLSPGARDGLSLEEAVGRRE